MDDLVAQKLRADLDEATKQHMPAMVVTTDYLRATLDRIQAIETSLAEARLQALEEAAKVADATMREEITGVQLGSSYRSGIRWAGERIKGAIRALASDPLLDRQGDGKEGV